MVNPALSVVGTHLENGDAETVHLRSVLVDRSESHKKQGTTSDGLNPAESWFTNADVQTIKAHGANCFEIHADRFKDWSNTRGVLNDSYFTTWVDVWVQWATDNQIYIILNVGSFNYTFNYRIPSWIWEDAGYEQPTTKAEWDAMLRDFFDTDVVAMNISRQGFIDVWKAVANRYKANPYVVFSPMDEPYMMVELNAEQSTHLGQTYATFMEALVDGIHSTGSTNLILIDKPFVHKYAPYWDNIKPVNKTGIAWTSSLYMGSYNNLLTLDAWQDAYTTKLLPKFITEFAKPFMQSGFGFAPEAWGKTNYPDNFLALVQGQIDFIVENSVCGRQWYEYGAFEGEYWDFIIDLYTQAESDALLDIIFGGVGNGGNGEPTTIFESGFETETNDFNVEWTNKEVTGGETGTVVTTDPHHGSKHAQFSCDGSAPGEMAYCYKLLAGQSKLFLRTYIKVKTNLPTSGGEYQVASLSYDADWIVTAKIVNVGGVLKWRLSYHNGANHVYADYQPSTPIALDTWYCFEVYALIHATAGAFKLFIDGNSLISVSGIATNEHGNITRISVGERYSTLATAHTIYIDCVKTSDTYVDVEETPPPTDYYLLVIAETENGITIPESNIYEHLANDVVSIRAVPLQGHVFIKWMYDSTEFLGNPIVLTMTQDFTVTASFRAFHFGRASRHWRR